MNKNSQLLFCQRPFPGEAVLLGLHYTDMPKAMGLSRQGQVLPSLHFALENCWKPT